MDKQTSENILEYLRTTETFFLEEAPEVIQEALKYHYFSNLILFSLGLASILLLLITSYLFYKYPKLDETNRRTTLSEFGCFFPLIFSIIFITPTIICGDNLLKIILAPKYHLIKLFT